MDLDDEALAGLVFRGPGGVRQEPVLSAQETRRLARPRSPTRNFSAAGDHERELSTRPLPQVGGRVDN